MRVDQVEVVWDNPKSKWAVRIVSGEEVIRRYSDQPKNADEQVLKSAALQTAKDEGYEADAAQVSVRRS